MKMRKKIIFGVIVIVLLGMMLANFPSDQGPSQNGKALDEWLLFIYRSKRETHFFFDTRPQEAINALGTNAVPHLVRRISEGEPTELPLTSLIDKFPRLRRIAWLRKWANYDSRQARADGASDAFWYLGQAGDSAVTKLTLLAGSQNSPVTARRALHALGGIGTTNCLPPLLAAMGYSNLYLRATAACALHNLHAAARPAIPLLIASLQAPDPTLAICAATTLGTLKLEPELVVPALTKGLADSRPAIRQLTMVSLEEMGPLARPAVPALLKLTSAPDAKTREIARNTIWNIAPEALTNGSAQ